MLQIISSTFSSWLGGFSKPAETQPGSTFEANSSGDKVRGDESTELDTFNKENVCFFLRFLSCLPALVSLSFHEFDFCGLG